MIRCRRLRRARHAVTAAIAITYNEEKSPDITRSCRCCCRASLFFTQAQPRRERMSAIRLLRAYEYERRRDAMPCA